jgi:hypothetical protein
LGFNWLQTQWTGGASGLLAACLFRATFVGMAGYGGFYPAAAVGGAAAALGRSTGCNINSRQHTGNANNMLGWQITTADVSNNIYNRFLRTRIAKCTRYVNTRFEDVCSNSLRQQCTLTERRTTARYQFDKLLRSR